MKREIFTFVTEFCFRLAYITFHQRFSKGNDVRFAHFASTLLTQRQMADRLQLTVEPSGLQGKQTLLKSTK